MSKDKPVKLTEVPSSIEAAVITGALEAHRIKSFTTAISPADARPKRQDT